MTKLFKSLILSIILCSTLFACATSPGFSAKGKVTSIERGKDGYTAVLQTKNGVQYQAVISRINLANTSQYQELTVGDQVTVSGDTLKLGDTISIKVKQLRK